ncbi:uncharacterized protein LOC123528190 [Mercenaria mercenaria]|uniref:uncharacterized protein LOC123528190 n=1 Tax=Mercenaria mercenaria TaxID=6596 RepID=UPI00234E5568|nr:uncharacterized protein LOC123528190 [Mercenaria mercenaria]
MSTEEFENASDEIKNISCSVCSRKNVRREAKAYCTECQEYYCASCTDMHKMFSSMSGHRLLDKSTAGLPSTLQNIPTEYCSIHRGRLLEMYCSNHEEILCPTCAALNHRSCQSIHLIPDEIDSLYRRSEFDEATKQLHNIQKGMEDIKKSKETRMEEYIKCRKEVIDSVKKFRKEMEAALEKLETDLVKKVETECDKTEAVLQTEIIEVRKCIDELKQTASQLMKSVGNRVQEFVCVKTSEKVIRKANEAECLLQRTNEVGTSFSVDSIIQEFLEEMYTFGQVFISKRTYAEEKLTEVYVRTPNDINKCNIFGACFIDDGSLLLADYGNITLKRVDLSSYSVRDYVELNDSPFAICETYPNNVAVSHHNYVIQFVAIGKEMVKYKKLRLGHFCFSLAFKDGKLFISDRNISVYIYDMSGILLSKTDTENAGNPIFSECRMVVPSTIGDKVFVVDRDNGLITFDSFGNYESTFTDPNLIQTTAVCADKRGNLFVCEVESLNIVQISEKPKRVIGVIVREVAENPRDSYVRVSSICFDPNGNKLIVVYSGDYIDVFQLAVTHV